MDASEAADSASIAVATKTGGTSRLRVRDDQLDDLLRLASGCVRSGRCPGDARVRDLLARFDAEAAAAKQREEEEDAADDASQEASRMTSDEADQQASKSKPPVKPSEAERSIDAATLRKEIAELERVNTNKRMELQDSKQTLAKHVLEHSNVRKKLDSVETEVRRLNKELKLAKVQSNRHETEMLDLQEALELAVQRPATVPADSKKTPQAPAGPRPEKARRGRKASRPGSDAHVSAEVGAGADESEQAPPLEDDPLAAADELKHALLSAQDVQLDGEDALWHHFKCENAKLASVIDAVGELHEQLNHSPEYHPPPPQPRSGPGALPGMPPTARKHWTYSSVLSQGYQKYRKLYI